MICLVDLNLLKSLIKYKVDYFLKSEKSNDKEY